MEHRNRVEVFLWLLFSRKTTGNCIHSNLLVKILCFFLWPICPNDYFFKIPVFFSILSFATTFMCNLHVFLFMCFAFVSSKRGPSVIPVIQLMKYHFLISKVGRHLGP